MASIVKLLSFSLERARGGSPGDETSGLGRIWSDHHRLPNRPRATARRHRVVSLVTHADIPDIVWADDETGCYAVRGRDVKGNRIVVEQSGPIRIVSARR